MVCVEVTSFFFSQDIVRPFNGCFLSPLEARWLARCFNCVVDVFRPYLVYVNRSKHRALLSELTLVTQ